MKTSLGSLKESYRRFSEPEQQHRIARFVWSTIMLIGILSTGLGLLLGAYQFILPVDGSSETAQVKASQVFDPENLKATINKLTTRRDRFEELVSGGN